MALCFTASSPRSESPSRYRVTEEVVKKEADERNQRTPKLSLVMPVYNERANIEKILERVQSVEIDKEIIVVDDGSSDALMTLRAILPFFDVKRQHTSAM